MKFSTFEKALAKAKAFALYVLCFKPSNGSRPTLCEGEFLSQRSGLFLFKSQSSWNNKSYSASLTEDHLKHDIMSIIH